MTPEFDRLLQSLADRYDVRGEIGHGGMATVYRAHDRRHGRDVAIKVLRPEVASAMGGERFRREIQLAAQLQHPHILPLIDSGEVDGLLYYLMPFVSGESLRQRLEREGALPVDDALRLAGQVADALDAAHRRGVVHRDIKPENILLQDGQALVADFGIARAMQQGADDSLTLAGLSLGTPAYMSPEQIEGSAEVDGRSDVYALGCVLFEMLTGHAPFRAPTAQALLMKHMTEAVPPLDGTREVVSNAVTAAVQQAMAKDRNARFATAGAFAQALDAARSVRTGPQATTPRRSGIGGRWLAAAVLVVVSAGLWFLASGRAAADESIRVAVMPFTATGPDLEVYREGMVDLLSTNLDDLGDIRAIASRTVLARWDDAVEPGARPDLDVVLDIARETGASHAVVGSVVSVGSSVRLSARLYTLSDGEAEPLPDSDGPANEILGLVDELSVSVARTLLGESPVLGASGARLASVMTSSVPALRSYLKAESHFRKGEFPLALPLLDEAIRTDTLFGLAIVRRAQTLGWMPNLIGPDSVNAARRAIRPVLSRLAPRDAILAEAGIIDFADRDYRGVEMLRDFVARYPDEAEGWYQLSDFLYHLRDIRGGTREEVLGGFDKAVELGPKFAPYYLHAIDGAIELGDSVRVDQLLERYRALSGEDDRWQRWRLQRAIAFGDRATVAAADTIALKGAIAAMVTVSAHPQALAEASLRLSPTSPRRIGALIRAGRWNSVRSMEGQLRPELRALLGTAVVRWAGAFDLAPSDASLLLGAEPAGPPAEFWSADPAGLYRRLVTARDDGTGADPLLLAVAAERSGEAAALSLFEQEAWRNEGPAATFRVARLHDRAGRRAEALRWYVKFLEQWSGADASLPPVVEAKAAAARLR